MPELPDVEVFRQYIDATALRQTIQKVDVDTSILGDVSAEKLASHLKNTRLKQTLRHGKYLFVKTSRDQWLMMHFGMTGFPRYYKNDEKAPDHIRFCIDFKNGYHLAYDCQRKLGRIDLLDDWSEFVKDHDLGTDPYREEFDFSAFKNLMDGRRGTVKSALMNQKLIAGIGNVYSDEILFQSKIHPGSAALKLEKKQLKTIYRNLGSIMETVIEAHAETEFLPDRFLIPYRHDGEDCPICMGTIHKKTISGRSSYFCDTHQSVVD